MAFLLGSTMPDDRWAAATGIATLLLSLAGYYAMIELRYGYGAGTSSLIFWGLLAAVFIAEGLYLILILPDPAVGLGFIAVGALLPLAFGRSRDDRLGGYVAIAPALLLGVLGYVVFQWLYAWTATVG